MLSFALRGTITDIDATVPGDPEHPAAVLLIEADGSISRVIEPSVFIAGREELLCVGPAVVVHGQVRMTAGAFARLATEMELVSSGH